MKLLPTRSFPALVPVLIAIALIRSGITTAQEPTWMAPPRLAVGVVVDQMRPDFVHRYWDNFGEDGFKRLVREGAFVRDAHLNYITSETGPGHASIYSGTTPRDHGIVANYMYVRSTGATLYCVQDVNAVGVGCSGTIGQRSPANLLVTSMADEFERRFEGRSKTIGISLKDRGAILPMGRTGDAAYWLGNGTDGHWVTSDWYMGDLPGWVKEFNAKDLANAYLSGTWDLLLPRDRYRQVMPDDNPYEIPTPGSSTATLPQDLAPLLDAWKGNTKLIAYVPVGNTLTTDFALAALEGEELGKDDIPDLLSISYSAGDNIAHWVGQRALEMEDTYLRMDLEIARLLKALDEQVGMGNYTLFLTADHAGPDVPEYLKDLKGSAGYVVMGELAKEVNSGLVKRFGQGQWVQAIRNEQVFLNDSLILASKLEPALVQRVTADLLLNKHEITEALTAADLVRITYPDGIRAKLQRGFMLLRSGDVCFALRPGFIDPEDWAYERGTDHGSGWNYDSHIPLLFFGKGIRSGEIVRRVHVTDIVPTLSLLMGMTLPDAASGVAIPEVIGR